MYCFARVREVALALIVIAPLGVSPAAAQEEAAPAVASAVVALAPDLTIPGAPAPPPQFLPAIAAPKASPRRPASLLPLYGSFAALQVLDAHSTTRALNRGAVEANPLMKGIAGNPAALLAVKAAGTAGVFYASEKIWKKNRPAAILFMAAANSAMAWVVRHNYAATK